MQFKVGDIVELVKRVNDIPIGAQGIVLEFWTSSWSSEKYVRVRWTANLPFKVEIGLTDDYYASDFKLLPSIIQHLEEPISRFAAITEELTES